MSERIPGVVIGLVSSLDDPAGLGRVQLRFPWMDSGEPLSNWARVATPMAGNERGQQFMPEVDDEALVAFEHGDVTRPFIVGFLWNGKDKPPRDKPEIRVIRTVSGHTLEFDDTSGSEKIIIKFKDGDPSITLEATKISIKLDGGNLIEIEPSGVTVKGTQIKLN